MAVVKSLLLLAMVVMAASLQAASEGEEAGLARFPGRRRRRSRHRPRTSSAPPAPAAPGTGGRVPAPPPPSPLLPCNRPDVPPMLAGSASPPCIPTPTPPPPAPPTPPRFRRPQLCPCPIHRPYPPAPGGSGSGSVSGGQECVTTLVPLMSCLPFVTGSVEENPTANSDCCGGLGQFLNRTNGDGGELICLCPYLVGEVNKMLPKPVDPLRLVALPIACGVVLPPQIVPQVLFTCFTGHPSPHAAVNSSAQFWN